MISNLQAYVVLAVAAINLVLAGIILAQDLRDRTNRAFALLAATAASWGFSVGLYLLVPVDRLDLLSFFAKSLYFTGTSIAAAYLYFSLIFSTPERSLRWQTTLLVIGTVLMGVLHYGTGLIITAPLVLGSGLRGFEFGPLRFLIDIELWGGFALAFVVLIRKYLRAQNESRLQLRMILIGTYTTLLVAGTTNDIFLTAGIFQYLWAGPAAMVIWIASIAYAVGRLQLFNVKLIAAELFIGFLWPTLLLRAVFSSGQTELAVNGGFFLAIVVLGVFVVRTVIAEIRERELIEDHKAELESINVQQEALLAFISHEVKAYLAKGEAAFSSIEEGDYGEPAPELKAMATQGRTDVHMGIDMMLNILDASDLKRGNVSYHKKQFDLRRTVSAVVNTLRPQAEKNGLVLTYDEKPSDAPLMLVGDEEKISRHVVRNLVDNAIRYTLTGSVTVALAQRGATAHIVVADSGVGITPDDMGRLFTEGGHGKDSLKVNVHSTGYGLYIAKQVVDGHSGTIRAESDGAGKGSRFIVELPLSE